jgi:hypothetical protein
LNTPVFSPVGFDGTGALFPNQRNIRNSGWSPRKKYRLYVKNYPDIMIPAIWGKPNPGDL